MLPSGTFLREPVPTKLTSVRSFARMNDKVIFELIAFRDNFPAKRAIQLSPFGVRQKDVAIKLGETPVADWTV